MPLGIRPFVTELSGYEFETLREGREFVLYRGRQRDNAVSILVLAPVLAQQAPLSLARLEHEYSLADKLDPAWAVRPLALVRHDGRPMLVLQDPGGNPLIGVRGRPLEVTRFLQVAIALTAALRQVHQRGLIHKDIKPAHLLVDAAGHVWLTGFGIASLLPRERQAPAPPEIIAGTFAYMAPEQTGRMNRSIDARSDLYSLGVTLYELLTGALPFTASDPMEWVHCHVARQPAPPNERIEGIPDPIGAIILKLLAKTAEDRYQTAAGVEADLRRCLGGWETHRRIDPFRLAVRDAPDRLMIPEKLYGREAEIDALISAFDRVVAQGTTELVLVSGYAGIGKSSIVNELHKALVASRGLFAAGKFDQYKRNIPYATLAQAFQSLIRQLLSKNDAELARWRDALLEALGSSGQLMVNLIPELVHVIGDQPPVPELPPRDAQNRFQQVFRRFLAVFARAEHPLALFLDDLQWMDMATLELLERLATDPEVSHLLLVCAYRDNEVGPDHPLARALEAIRGTAANVQQIVLAPLLPSDVRRLVADALHAEPGKVQPLAELVFEKTGGNPFFAIQFVTALAEENLLSFNPDAAAWEWDMDRIRAKRITANVAELMAGKLNRLPTVALNVLQQLACLGNDARASTLTMLLGMPEDAVRAALWEAVRTGLVLRPEGGGYSFLHDRVQEAAYALIPDAERPAMHLRIGRVLASRTAAAELEESIFEIVNQLDRGAALIHSPEERRQVAALNLIAGKRAKASTAYASALAYFAAGSALLAGASWELDYRLMFDLERHRAECEFLTGDLPAAEARLSALSERVVDLVDRAAVARLRLALYTTLDRTDRGVEVGLDCLRHVGIELSPHPTDGDVSRELDRMWQLLAGRPIEQLLDLPLMTDPDWLATMDVLAELLPPARFTDNNLHDVVLLRMTNLSLEHGNCDASCHAYAVLNIALGLRLGDYQAGFRFGQLGRDLVDKRGLERFKARVYMAFGAITIPWTMHVLSGRVLIKQAFNIANAMGDLTYAVYSCKNLVTNLLISGEPLQDVQREAEQALAFARKARFGLYVDVFTDQLMLIRELRGLEPDIFRPEGSEQDDRWFERHLAEGGARLALATSWYWIHRMQARFLAQDDTGGVAAAASAHDLLWATRSHLEIAEYHFYGALTRAAACDSTNGELRERHFGLLQAHHRRIAVWAKSCPENFANRAALVAAEIARLEGRELDAMRLYEEAIRLARQYGFIQNEAIANELAARFYRARGFQTSADAYVLAARACYLRWGADGKVRLLDRSYPQLRQDLAAPRPESTIGTTVERLDLATMVKVSQAVSSEIDLPKLIDTFMVLALEQAGADRGLLILSRGEELQIEAEATTLRDTVVVRFRRSAVAAEELPESVLRYVLRTQDSLLLDDASNRNPFSGDRYIRRNRSRSILCLPLIKQAKLTGILYLENRLTSHVFTPARIAVLRLLASQAAISLENARLFADLQHAEAYLAESQRLAHMGSFAFNSSHTKLFWSEEIYRIYEVDRETAPTFEVGRQRNHPGEPTLVQKIMDRVSEDGGNHEFDHRLRMPDGSTKNLHVVVHAEKNAAGEVDYVGTVMDVTASVQAQERLRASLQEKEALLKEVHHRVKNNLQLISSLLSLQASRIADPAVAELFSESRNRVRSMALVHENLYRAGNFARIPMRTHVQNLCAHLTRAYGLHSRHVDLTTDIDEVELGLDQAIATGLIINELVSNALKHAFPDERPGRVRVELKLLPGGRCRLAVIDNGVGLPSDRNTQQADTVGLQLVYDLMQQLHARLDLQREGGTTFAIVFDADTGTETNR